MSYIRRRYLSPLALIAVSLAGLLLWLRYAAPDVVHHAVATSKHRDPTPGAIARTLRGAPTLTLKIVSEGGVRPVRFLIQSPALYHAAIGARLRATYPDARLLPVDARDADPLALRTVSSPGTAVRALRD